MVVSFRFMVASLLHMKREEGFGGLWGKEKETAEIEREGRV